MGQKRQYLHRFAETHIVRQARAQAELAQIGQPMKALRLVGAQRGAQRGWDLEFLLGQLSHAREPSLTLDVDLETAVRVV